MREKTVFNYTAEELIDVLQKFPPELPVLVTGYESGYENIYEPRLAELTRKPENMYWDGEFQKPEKDDTEIFRAIILERAERHD